MLCVGSRRDHVADFDRVHGMYITDLPSPFLMNQTLLKDKMCCVKDVVWNKAVSWEFMGLCVRELEKVTRIYD